MPSKHVSPTQNATDESNSNHALICANRALFPLGQIVATPGALALLQETGHSATALLRRHVTGDFGDLCEEDRLENEYAVSRRLRILSCYRLVDAAKLAATPRVRRSELRTLWVISEADRSATTLLKPSEY